MLSQYSIAWRTGYRHGLCASGAVRRRVQALRHCPPRRQAHVERVIDSSSKTASADLLAMPKPLRYFGTDDEVNPGDRVEYTSRFLRRKRIGTVVWIPERTALELDADGKAPESWLIKLDDGTFTGWMYHPEELQPTPRLRLIGRNADYEPVSNDELERQDSEIANQMGIFEQAAGCAFVILLVVAAVVIIASMFD